MSRSKSRNSSSSAAVNGTCGGAAAAAGGTVGALAAAAALAASSDPPAPSAALRATLAGSSAAFSCICGASFASDCKSALTFLKSSGMPKVSDDAAAVAFAPALVAFAPALRFGAILRDGCTRLRVSLVQTSLQVRYFGGWFKTGRVEK